MVEDSRVKNAQAMSDSRVKTLELGMAEMSDLLGGKKRVLVPVDHRCQATNSWRKGGKASFPFMIRLRSKSYFVTFRKKKLFLNYQMKITQNR